MIILPRVGSRLSLGKRGIAITKELHERTLHDLPIPVFDGFDIRARITVVSYAWIDVLGNLVGYAEPTTAYETRRATCPFVSPSFYLNYVDTESGERTGVKLHALGLVPSPIMYTDPEGNAQPLLEFPENIVHPSIDK